VSCSPMDVERYNVGLLLCYRRGPKSFEYLRAVNAVLYPTFKDAALAHGYLEDDSEWKSCMGEAVTFQVHPHLRHLFSTILLFCQPSNVRSLWDESAEAMSQGFQRERHANASHPVVILMTVKDIDN
jgi:hypothetical protein